MVEQHARPGIAHHDAHPFLHFGLVAVYGTLAAGLFPVAEGAVCKPGVGIGQQFPALRA